ncbi:MAG: PPC domain-containing protein, partial [Pirellula sp.]
MRFFSKLQCIYLLVYLLLIGWAGDIHAAVPEANSVSVAGLQRGTSVELTISGARLGDAHSLLFFTLGLEATNITKVDDNNIKATITASADAACDLHPFRVVTKTGISNMRLLNVSALPSATEAEPNSEFAAAQAIEMNCTVNGVVQNEDVDYYAVELKQGQQLNVELEGLRHAYLNDFFDPYIAIYDAKRFEITASDDSVFLQQDCLCSMIAPADGRYVIEVRESSFGGNDRCKYRLHVGSFPRPVAMIPSGGPPGVPLKTTCIDLLGNRWEETFEMPAVATEGFRVWSKRDGQQSPSPNFLRVNAATNVVETEPNSDHNAIPSSFPVPVAFNGILESEKDKDFWVFEAKKDQQLEIRVHARQPLRSSVDPVLQIWKVGGGVLANNDDSGGPDSYLNFKVPADGAYAVCVYDHLGRFGAHFAYRAEVQLQNPEVGTTVNEQDRYVSQTVSVPRGSRMAIEANVVRKFAGGEAVVSASELPPGMSHSEGLCPADLGTIPLIFRGDAGAPNAGRLVDLTATITQSPEKQIAGPLRQRTQLVRGQNNVDVWGRTESKLAVALTEPPPFDIEVVQPQVPLVRNGSINLVVNAKRTPGYDKPISLRLLSSPPGIGFSAVTIPGDQSSILLPLTANNGAGIRKWPLVVMATADSGFGPIKLASEFVNVEVGESLFEFKFTKTMAEQGKPADVVVAAKLKKPVEGNIEIEILGIPPGTQATSPKVSFAADATKVVFPLE